MEHKYTLTNKSLINRGNESVFS